MTGSNVPNLTGIQDSAELVQSDPHVAELRARGVISIEDGRVTYNLNQRRSYQWTGRAEEWVRARSIAFLVVEKGYPANRMKTEVSVPRRIPEDRADNCGIPR